MIVRWGLRGIAVLIAVLGVIDPVLTRMATSRPALVIAAQESNVGAGDPAWTSALTLQQLLAQDYDLRLRRVARGDRATACDAGVPCVLVGEDRWSLPVVGLGTGHAPAGSAAAVGAPIVGAVRLPEAGSRVRIVDAVVATAAAPSSVGSLLVSLDGRGVAGKRSLIEVIDGDVPVGYAEHAWTADGSVSVPIEWWPLAAGVRRLSLRATGIAAEGAVDDRIELGVPIESEPYGVLIYDPRPSWTSTFLRRAIEKDARLTLRVLARLGPQLQVTAGTPFRLDAAALADASAVVVGALDELTERDVDLLDRFVRVRGGTLILAPDRRPSGPAARLLPPGFAERLEPSPLRIGGWRASELLVMRDARPGVRTLAAAGDDPVVVAVPAGNGRVVVSGAMDAWRYRDQDDDAFDAAWQSLVADGAAAGGRPLDVTLRRAVVGPGEDVDVSVSIRAMEPLTSAVAAGATVACGDEAPRPLRLWPGGDRRHFEGRFAAPAAGDSTCRVAVSSSAPVAATRTADLQVSSGAGRPLGAATASLEQLTAPAGVQVVTAGDEATLARDVRRLVPAAPAAAEARPMRSPWWIVPFAACLGLEWWLRRRVGLR